MEEINFVERWDESLVAWSMFQGVVSETFVEGLDRHSARGHRLGVERHWWSLLRVEAAASRSENKDS